MLKFDPDKSSAELLCDDQSVKRTKMRRLSWQVRQRIIRKALLARQVEERLLELYGQGKLFGTIHTCIGQEFSGAVVTEFLQLGDSVFSNHRCHGHFLAFTGDAQGLIAETMGKESGVCAGRGGSQHLCKDGFYSNGVQGGILPVAAGLAMAHKLDGKHKICTAFIGDGTLGEGVVYETLNIVAKWELPLLIILENNGYAQSTPQSETLSGEICARAEAFAIRTAKGNTWDWEQLYTITQELVAFVRDEGKPAFLQIDTFRLKAHSKGDDNRPRSEIEIFEASDPLNRMISEGSPEVRMLQAEITHIVDQAVGAADKAAYPQTEQHPDRATSALPIWIDYHPPVAQRMVKAINQALNSLMQANPKALLLGEDVRSPYGGAFKVTQDLSRYYPDRVFNTPISEAALVGMGSGLALRGYFPLVEIMFGDFMSLTLDQILNHASKFRYMYNNQVTNNFVVRTPMGGGRGYGPTHSQTLDRHFMGIPGLTIVALNTLLEPHSLYQKIIEQGQSITLVIENKLQYAQQLRAELPPGFKALVTDEAFPTVWIKPDAATVDVTLIGYGGLSETLLEAATLLFNEHELLTQVICPSQIYPFNVQPLLPALAASQTLVFVEEGQGFAGFSSEVIAQIAERDASLLGNVIRVIPPQTPIPATKSAELAMLPNPSQIIAAILKTKAGPGYSLQGYLQ